MIKEEITRKILKKIIASSQADNVTPVKGSSKNRKIISTGRSKLSNQGIIYPLIYQINLPEFVNFVLLKRGKGLLHKEVEMQKCSCFPDLE